MANRRQSIDGANACGRDAASMRHGSSVAQPDLTDAERARVVEAVKARVDGYVDAARRLDLEWFRDFWADHDDFLIAADGVLMDYTTWSQQLARDLAGIRAMTAFEFFNGHTHVLSRDAAVHTTQFRWTLVDKAGDTVSMHGAWSYVFKNIGGVWKVIHSAGTHLPA